MGAGQPWTQRFPIRDDATDAAPRCRRHLSQLAAAPADCRAAAAGPPPFCRSPTAACADAGREND